MCQQHLHPTRTQLGRCCPRTGVGLPGWSGWEAPLTLLPLPHGTPGFHPDPAGSPGHLGCGVAALHSQCSALHARSLHGQQQKCLILPSLEVRGCPSRTGGSGETPSPASHPECVCAKCSVATQSNKRPSPSLLQPPAPEPRTSSPWPSPIPLPVQGQSLPSILSPPAPSWDEGGWDPQTSSSALMCIESKRRMEG